MGTGRRALLIAALAVVLGASLTAAPSRRVSAQITGWVSRAPMPLARAAGVAVTGPDGRIYVFGGSNGATNFAEADAYSPPANGWTPIAPLPVPLSFMGGTLGADGKIYLIGGWDGVSSQNDVIAYDPVHNTYACSFAHAGCAASFLAPMPTARSNLGVAAGSDGLIYAVGGFTTQPVATVEVYDPVANDWQEETPLPHPASGLGVTANPDGSLIVAGGYDGQSYLNTAYIGHPQSSPVRSRRLGSLIRSGASGLIWAILEKYSYDLKNGQLVAMYLVAAWLVGLSDGDHPGSPVPLSARDLRASVPGPPGYVTVDLVLGGDSGGTASNSVTLLNPNAGKWYTGNPLPTARTRAMAAVGTDGTLYIMGGDDGNPLNPFASMDAWVPPPPPPSPTATPTLPLTSTPTSTPGPTSTPTPSPSPTATSAPTMTPLTVTVRVASKKVGAGKRQTVTVTTQTGNAVSITASFPGGRRTHHAGTADPTGIVVWRFKQPSLPRGVKTHTVKIAVTVTDPNGRTVNTSVRYTGT